MELLLKILNETLTPIYVEGKFGDGSLFKIKTLIEKAGLTYDIYDNQEQIKALRYFKSGKSIDTEDSNFAKSLNEKDVIILWLEDLTNILNITYLKAIIDDMVEGVYKSKLIFLKKGNKFDKLHLEAIQARMLCCDIESLLAETNQ